MNIEKLQRFRHDSKGVHEDQNGDYLWYDDVVTLIEEDRKERERCVEVLKSAILFKVEGKRVSHPMDSLKSRLAELEGIAEKLNTFRINHGLQHSGICAYRPGQLNMECTCGCDDLYDAILAYKEGKK